jgi:uncharacterized protein (TIGR02996 family)
MPDEATMLAAYAASYPDDTDRLILADWLEERGDVRGTWLRDPDLARYMGPNLDDPRAKLIAALADDPKVAELLARLGSTDLNDLVERLKSDDPREQRAALAALGELGEQAVPAVPAILERLRSWERGSVREAAIAILDNLGSYTPAALLAAASNVAGHAVWFQAVLARGPDVYTVRCLHHALYLSDDLSEQASSRLTELGPAAFPGLLAAGLELGDEGWEDVIQFLANPAGHAWLLAVARDAGRLQPERVRALELLAYEGTPFPAEDEGLLPGLLELLDDADPEMVGAALSALSRFEQRVEVAIPVLERLLVQPEGPHRWSAFHRLAELGSASGPTFHRLLASGDPALRSFGRRGVMRIEEPAVRAECVRQWLASPLTEERLSGVGGLAGGTALLPDVDVLLLAALNDPVEEVRAAAARTIPEVRWPTNLDPTPLWRAVLASPEGRLGAMEALRYPHRSLAPLVLPELLEIARNAADSRGRIAALGCLCAEGLDRPEVQRVALDALGDTDPDIFSAAVFLLSTHWRPLPAEAVAALVARVRDDPSERVDGLIEYLVPRGYSPNREAPAPEVRAALTHRLRTHPIPPRGYLYEALYKIDFVPDEGDLPVLLRDVEQMYVPWLLERYGPAGIPHLVRMLGAGNTPDTQASAARVLRSFEQSSRPALPALRFLLTSDAAEVRWAAAEAIAEIAEPAELVEWLRPCFQDRDWGGPRFALGVAEKLGDLALAWLPEILAVVQTEEAELAVETHPVLIALAAHSPEVEVRLAAMVKDPDPIASANAQAALDAIAAARNE